MKIKIPKQFNIFGHTYSVEFDEKLVRDQDALGLCDSRHQKIILQPSSSGVPRNNTQIEQSYLHEIVHCVLRELNYGELDKDEQFIDNFSQCLHQIITSSKY